MKECALGFIMCISSILLYGCRSEDDEILIGDKFIPIKVEFVGVEPRHLDNFVSECSLPPEGSKFSVQLYEKEIKETFSLGFSHMSEMGRDCNKYIPLSYGKRVDAPIKEYWGEISFEYNPFLINVSVDRNATKKSRLIEIVIGDPLEYRMILIRQAAEKAN